MPNSDELLQAVTGEQPRIDEKAFLLDVIEFPMYLVFAAKDAKTRMRDFGDFADSVFGTHPATFMRAQSCQADLAMRRAYVLALRVATGASYQAIADYYQIKSRSNVAKYSRQALAGPLERSMCQHLLRKFKEHLSGAGGAEK